jgi:hypothetical protein
MLATAVFRLAAHEGGDALACWGPALALPVVGLAILLGARDRPILGWTVTTLGLAFHAVTAVAIVSTGC